MWDLLGVARTCHLPVTVVITACAQKPGFPFAIYSVWDLPETDGTIGIVSKVPILRQLVSVSVSIQEFLESRYQYRYRSRALSIFWKVLAEFLLSKVSVSVSVPVQFHGISISIGLDVDWVWVSVSVSVSIQGPIKYQYQYRLEISGPVCLWIFPCNCLQSLHIYCTWSL